MSRVQQIHVQCLAPAVARRDVGLRATMRVSVRSGHVQCLALALARRDWWT
jgi:hypothetical protein